MRPACMTLLWYGSVDIGCLGKEFLQCCWIAGVAYEYEVTPRSKPWAWPLENSSWDDCMQELGKWKPFSSQSWIIKCFKLTYLIVFVLEGCFLLTFPSIISRSWWFHGPDGTPSVYIYLVIRHLGKSLKGCFCSSTAYKGFIPVCKSTGLCVHKHFGKHFTAGFLSRSILLVILP